jgi:hypothetical protein
VILGLSFCLLAEVPIDGEIRCPQSELQRAVIKSRWMNHPRQHATPVSGLAIPAEELEDGRMVFLPRVHVGYD